MFPVINHIDEVREVIGSNPLFSVHQKEDYIVIDYIYSTPELFNNPIEKECRGLIFDAVTGKVRSRRLHKFFNFGERPESTEVDLSKPHVILEKLDGSMVTPLMVNDKLSWASKAGETFITDQVKEFIKDKSDYTDFVELLMKSGFTPIFEWCSRKNRVVIDHPKDRLVLIAIRDNVTGEYVSFENIKELIEGLNIELVKTFDGTVDNIQHLVEQTRGMSGVEGFVVAFEDGHRIKIKADEYVLHHKAKDNINYEKNVLEIILERASDDFKVLLSEHDRSRFEKFENDFWYQIEINVNIIYQKINSMKSNKVTKKYFALNFQKNYDKNIRSIFFDLLEVTTFSLEDVRDRYINIIKKNVGSQTEVDSIRHLFNVNWYDY